MVYPDNELVVLDIAGDCARVVCNSHDNIGSLVRLGFTLEGDQWVRPIIDVLDRQTLVCALIELKALFSDGGGWSPAELVDFFRTQGATKTTYRMISWRSPNQYVIVDR